MSKEMKMDTSSVTPAVGGIEKLGNSLFKEFQLSEKINYKDILEKTWLWTQRQPVCDYVNFEFINEVSYVSFRKSGPISNAEVVTNILNPPEELAVGLAHVFNLQLSFPRVHPDAVRLLYVTGSIPPHSDRPFRKTAVNLGITDALGLTKSKFCFGSDLNNFDNDEGFYYEYGKVYYMNVEKVHYVKVDLMNSPARLVASVSFKD